MTIQVFKPNFDKVEVEAVREVLLSGWVGLGPKTDLFEREFANYVGASYAIGVNSGTSALHLSLAALGIGPGDEVLVPTITFASTAHAVSYCGATPVFVDIEADTLNVDVDKLKQYVTQNTKAIIPVHFGGHCCNMESIWRFATAHDLFVIEDAAHACGSKHDTRMVGSLPSETTCFSFHAVKNLACGDGGMITTSRLDIAQALRKLRWCGIDKSTWDRVGEYRAAINTQYAKYSWYYEIHQLGFKAHMNDITAAIGLVQLGKLDGANERRRKIARRYTDELSSLDWLTCPGVLDVDYGKSAWHNYVIKTDRRDELNTYLKEFDIMTGVHYMPLHLQPYYRTTSALPVAERVWPKLLTLPLYPSLTDDEVGQVIRRIKAFQ